MITDVKINEAEKRRYYENGAWGTDTIADVWRRPQHSIRRSRIRSGRPWLLVDVSRS